MSADVDTRFTQAEATDVLVADRHYGDDERREWRERCAAEGRLFVAVQEDQLLGRSRITLAPGGRAFTQKHRGAIERVLAESEPARHYEFTEGFVRVEYRTVEYATSVAHRLAAALAKRCWSACTPGSTSWRPPSRTTVAGRPRRTSSSTRGWLRWSWPRGS